ncbi:MAG: biotin--[acetyl-CoA-carboxylase] ligase [Aestuariivirga sp.]
MRIHRLATVDSTNLEARRLVEAGERGPLWIVSAEQTAGKGRLGRNWVSKPGNFYGTLLWPTTAPPVAMAQVSFVAALAVHQTASKFVEPKRILLKWPNDCLLDGAKFCGILAEVMAPGLLAIGIGINIARVPDDLPYQASRLDMADVGSVFEHLQLNLSNNLAIWNAGQGFERIRQDWVAHCPHVYQTVSVDGVQGLFEGLGQDGALLLRLANGECKHIYAGDMRVEYQKP